MFNKDMCPLLIIEQQLYNLLTASGSFLNIMPPKVLLSLIFCTTGIVSSK